MVITCPENMEKWGNKCIPIKEIKNDFPIFTDPPKEEPRLPHPGVNPEDYQERIVYPLKEEPRTINKYIAPDDYQPTYSVTIPINNASPQPPQGWIAPKIEPKITNNPVGNRPETQSIRGLAPVELGGYSARLRKKKLTKKPATRKCSCKKPVKKSAKKSIKPVKRSAKKALKSIVKRTGNVLDKATNMFGVKNLNKISKNF